MRFLSPILALLALCLPSVAPAQSHGGLEFGAHLLLEQAFEGDAAARGLAAIALDNAGWEAWLTGSPLSASAGEDERALHEALLCASADDPAGCQGQADRAIARGHALAASLYLLRGCQFGDSAACDRLPGIDAPLPDPMGLTAPTPAELVRWKLPLEGAVPKGSLKKVLKACDASGAKQDLLACVTLAGLWNQRAPIPAERAAIEAALDDQCDQGAGSGSACELMAQVRQPDVPVDPALTDAAQLLRFTCSQGTVEEACLLHARILDAGRGVAYGHWGSRMSYGYACDGGASVGCGALTAAYESPMADLIPTECARVLAGEGGDPRACTEEHTMRTFGVHLDKDLERAEELKEAACAAGDFRPCVWLGNNAWEEDKAAAFRWYDHACTGGDGISCGVVGRMRTKGEHDIPQDGARGADILRRGCELGGANACFEWGYSNSQARGISKDSEEAARAYAASCSAGNPNGCSSLGILLMDGRGTTQSLDDSLWMLNQACDGGLGSACRNLGNGYRDALLGPKNDDHARWAYGKGCDLEHEDSCTKLAELGPGEATEPPRGTQPTRSRFGSNPMQRDTPFALPEPAAKPAPGGGPSPPRPPGGGGDLPGFDGGPHVGPWVGFGAARSLTDKVQYSLMGVGMQARLGPLAFGGRFEWLSDNRWKSANRTYQRILGRVEVGVHLPLHDLFALGFAFGGAVGSYRFDHDDAEFGPGLHQAVQLMIGGPEMGDSAGFVAIRWEQYQYIHSERTDPVEHAGGAWLIIGGYFDR